MKKNYLLIMAFVMSSFCYGQVVISQIYGGANDPSSTYKGDFIELFNKGTVAFDLSGYSIQYSGATAGTWFKKNFAASTVLQPGKYFLIFCNASGSVGTTGLDLPVEDLTFGVNVHANNAKVALVKNQVLLTGSDCSILTAIVDLVGYGSSTCFEGTSAIGALTVTTAAIRNNNGMDDTNNNSTDFTIGIPSPRNSSFTLGINKNQIEGFSMYPNPVANGKFLISTKGKEDKIVKIYSLLGKQVYSKTVKRDEIIQISNLVTGIYVMRVEEEGKIATSKLVVQ